MKYSLWIFIHLFWHWLPGNIHNLLNDEVLSPNFSIYTDIVELLVFLKTSSILVQVGWGLLFVNKRGCIERRYYKNKYDHHDYSLF